MSEIAVIWDMDGTLLDTFELHFQTWRESLAPYETKFNREVFRQYFGRNNQVSIPKYFGYKPDAEFISQLAEVKEKLFLDRLVENVSLFPGVIHWLDFLKSSGVRQAIASSAPLLNVQQCARTYKIGSYFDLLASGEPMRSKPAPDLFLYAAGELGIPPSCCVVIEDSMHGLQAAKAAGMLSIGKLGTSNLLPEDADILIPDYQRDPQPIFNDLLERIKQRNQERAR